MKSDFSASHCPWFLEMVMHVHMYDKLLNLRMLHKKRSDTDFFSSVVYYWKSFFFAASKQVSLLF